MNETSPYSGYIRLRVGGLYIQQEKLLLIKLKSPISGEDIWIPPGGGVDFKERLEDALVREFDEETRLKIEVGSLRFTSEIIEKEFHVIEFFFDVKRLSGEVSLGSDPEHRSEDQLMTDIGFFSREEIEGMNVKPEFLKKDFWESTERSLFLRNR